MIRTAAIVLAAALGHAPLLAQSPESFALTANKAVDAIAKRADVYFVERQNIWVKRFLQVKDVKFDVVKTASELNPIVGVFSASLLAGVARAPSEAEAAAAVTPTNPPTLSSRVELKFTRAAGKWVLLEGKDIAPEGSFEIRPFDRSSTRLSPSQALVATIEQLQQ